MSAASNRGSVPSCGCREELRERFRALGLDAHVTHEQPYIRSPYEDLAMTCPHGVTWHTEPTGEQREKWARLGIA